MAKKLHALIVDDEPDIGLMVSTFLKNEGHQAHVAHRCQSAKKLIESQRFDVFFLDINLPDGLGFDLLPMIQQFHPKAKIAMISAFDDAPESENFKKFRIHTFLRKPFSKKQVVDVINHFC